MTYQAPILLGAMFVFWLWEKICIYKEKNNGTKQIPGWAQFPGALYFFFALIVAQALYETHAFVMVPSGHLDPLTTEQCFNRSLFADSGETDTDKTYLQWKEEASLDDYPILTFLSKTGVVWMLATYVVCGWHTYEHMLQAGRDLCDESNKRAVKHCMTIKIVALPMIYGIMSYKSVVRAQQVVINHIGAQQAHGYASWEARKSFLEEMYEANFMVGDIYEAYALRMFGVLVTGVIEYHLITAERVKSKAAGKLQIDAQQESAVKAMAELCMSGVDWFYYSCFSNGVYWTVISTCAFYKVGDSMFSSDPENLGYFQTEAVKSYAKAFFTGAGLVASCAAINNLIFVEHHFKDKLEDGMEDIKPGQKGVTAKPFGPFWKFWGTKILVSLAFLQSIILAVIPPFSSWTPSRVNLLYASLLTFECLLVSLLHYYAWKSEELWYFLDEEFGGKDNEDCKKTMVEFKHNNEGALKKSLLG